MERRLLSPHRSPTSPIGLDVMTLLTRSGAPAVAVLLVALATLAVLLGCDRPTAPDPGGAKPRADFVLALAGAGDVLAAGTRNGIRICDLSSHATGDVGLEDGLAGIPVTALAFDARAEVLLGASAAGFSRGWFDGKWDGHPASIALPVSVTARPGGGFLAAGNDGVLFAWVQDRFDTLSVPAGGANIVGLDCAPGWIVPQEPDAIEQDPSFPPGLVVATADDGMWLLRSAGVNPRWLQIGVRDGLPEAPVRGLAADDASRLWLATDAGVVCVEPDLRVRTWPGDPGLAPPAELVVVAGGALWIGRDTGLARVPLDCDLGGTAISEPVAGVAGPVRALAWTTHGLWWTDGATVRSTAGDVIPTRPDPPRTICPLEFASQDVSRSVSAPPVGGVLAGPARPRSTTRAAAAGALRISDGTPAGRQWRGSRWSREA
jgi:hypothetical protein